MRFTMTAAAALLALVAAPSVARGQDFEWKGHVDRGDAVEIKGINGTIMAERASGGDVQVTAVKKAKDDDPDDVKIEVVKHDGGVTICAVYPSSGDRPNKCAPGDEARLSSRNNDVSVNFTVRVPDGVRFIGSTVNGNVEATGLTADVDAETVNGSVDVRTAGLVRAQTVNGRIKAAMGRADWKGEIALETVNGEITAELPAGANVDVRASTVNGGMETDFPLTIKGRFSMKEMQGTIGSGGRKLSLSTVNGSIHLKKTG